MERAPDTGPGEPGSQGLRAVSREGPVGVFDSGMGGLSVLREIRKALPAEDLLYVADSGYAPYGDRPREFIRSRSAAIADFFLRSRVKAMVVACNTVTGVAIEDLRARCPVPVVAIEPAIKPAAGMTKSGVVGVLATRRTIDSPRVSRLISLYGNGVRVLLQPCPGLVELVERAELAGPATGALVERYVAPMLEMGADTIVLGCTHYPFLVPLIQEITGPGVIVLDPAAAVARELGRRLTAGRIASPSTRKGVEKFWTSGPVDHARWVIGELWGGRPEVRRLPPDCGGRIPCAP